MSRWILNDGQANSDFSIDRNAFMTRRNAQPVKVPRGQTFGFLLWRKRDQQQTFPRHFPLEDVRERKRQPSTENIRERHIADAQRCSAFGRKLLISGKMFGKRRRSEDFFMARAQKIAKT